MNINTNNNLSFTSIRLQSYEKKGGRTEAEFVIDNKGKQDFDKYKNRLFSSERIEARMGLKLPKANQSESTVKIVVENNDRNIGFDHEADADKSHILVDTGDNKFSCAPTLTNYFGSRGYKEFKDWVIEVCGFLQQEMTKTPHSATNNQKEALFRETDEVISKSLTADNIWV